MALITETTDAPETIETPYSMMPGDTFAGTLDRRFGKDWVAVDLEAGRLYALSNIRMEGDGGLADPWIELFDAEGAFIAHDDDSAGNLNAVIVYTPQSSGTYFLSAQAYAGGSTGAYEMSVVAGQEETEDAPADATTPYSLFPRPGYATGLDTTGEIGTPGDVDWFAVDLSPGESYRFFVEAGSDGRAGLFDPVLTLHDSDGNVVASDDDGGRGFDASVILPVETAGTYYLAASGLEAGDTGTYRIGVFSEDRTGTQGDDTIVGTDTGDFISGRGGDDVLDGRRGRDNMVGGKGDDDVAGGIGNDVVAGNRGRDKVDGGEGDDRVMGGAGRDTLRGGDGNDTVIGGRHDDRIITGDGTDWIIFKKNDGNDTVIDFATAEDRLVLNCDLWANRDLSVGQVLNRYAAEFAVDALPDGSGPTIFGGVTLFFKGGESITLYNTTLLGDDLANAIDIV